MFVCEYKYIFLSINMYRQSKAKAKQEVPEGFTSGLGGRKCHCPHPGRAVLCVAAPCGGTVHNATIGRVLSPSYNGNQSGSMYCVWAIGAPPGQKLHLHFEKLLLTEKDR